MITKVDCLCAGDHTGGGGATPPIKKRRNRNMESSNNEDWDTIRTFQSTKIEQKIGIIN